MVSGQFLVEIISVISTVNWSSRLENNNKRIKVDFISWRQISAVIGGFVKQVLKKQWPNVDLIQPLIKNR